MKLITRCRRWKLGVQLSHFGDRYDAYKNLIDNKSLLHDLKLISIEHNKRRLHITGFGDLIAPNTKVALRNSSNTCFFGKIISTASKPIGNCGNYTLRIDLTSDFTSILGKFDKYGKHSDFRNFLNKFKQKNGFQNESEQMTECDEHMLNEYERLVENLSHFFSIDENDCDLNELLKNFDWDDEKSILCDYYDSISEDRMLHGIENFQTIAQKQNCSKIFKLVNGEIIDKENETITIINNNNHINNNDKNDNNDANLLKLIDNNIEHIKKLLFISKEQKDNIKFVTKKRFKYNEYNKTVQNMSTQDLANHIDMIYNEIADTHEGYTLANLNHQQFNSLQDSLSKTISLIHGPPGTGKTTTLVEIPLFWYILKQLKKQIAKNIMFGGTTDDVFIVKDQFLMTAYKHGAVDQMVRALRKRCPNLFNVAKIMRLGSLDSVDKDVRFF